MARRKYTHQDYDKVNKVKGVEDLVFVLFAVALTAAVMGGTFSCGMVGWSKYFC